MKQIFLMDLERIQNRGIMPESPVGHISKHWPGGVSSVGGIINVAELTRVIMIKRKAGGTVPHG